MLKCVLAGLIVAVTIASGAAAGPLEDGLAAYERGDYATALSEFRPLAEQGNAVAEYRLGYMYENGSGLPQDDAEAAKWYRKAASDLPTSDAVALRRSGLNPGLAQQRLKIVEARIAAASPKPLPASPPTVSEPAQSPPTSGVATETATPDARPSQVLALSGNDRWVAIASRQELGEAISFAQFYSAQNSRVMRANNGWYAVVLGPYATSDIGSFLRDYRGPTLPPDAMLTRGTGYVETVWQPSGDQSPPASPPAARKVVTSQPASKPENCFWKWSYAESNACKCRNAGYRMGTSGFDQCFANAQADTAAMNAAIAQNNALYSVLRERALEAQLNALRPIPSPAPVQTYPHNCTSSVIGNQIYTNCN